MIDFGFTERGLNLINSYFLVMIGIAAVLAFASASRYYLVTTLGERIVADLRSDVFAHLTALSAAFFDEARTGEMISRLTADTTQIKASVGSSISVALRNCVLFLGASVMMVVTSPKLSAFVLAAIPIIVLPLYAFGRAVRRRSRFAQDTLADASAYAAELIGAIRVLQAFTNERLGIARFRGAVEQAFFAARDSIRSRALLTGLAIFLVSSSVVVVLWIGAQEVLSQQITPGRLGQFILYAVLASSAFGSLSEIGGEIAAASGAAERLFEILAIKPAIFRPAQPLLLPCQRAARRFSRTCVFHIRRARMLLLSTAYRFACGRVRSSRSSAPRVPARARSFICCCAFMTPHRGALPSTACGLPISIRRICAPASRSCRRTA